MPRPFLLAFLILCLPSYAFAWHFAIAPGQPDADHNYNGLTTTGTILSVSHSSGAPSYGTYCIVRDPADHFACRIRLTALSGTGVYFYQDHYDTLRFLDPPQVGRYLRDLTDDEYTFTGYCEIDAFGVHASDASAQFQLEDVGFDQGIQPPTRWCLTEGLEIFNTSVGDFDWTEWRVDLAGVSYTVRYPGKANFYLPPSALEGLMTRRLPGYTMQYEMIVGRDARGVDGPIESGSGGQIWPGSPRSDGRYNANDANYDDCPNIAIYSDLSHVWLSYRSTDNVTRYFGLYPESKNVMNGPGRIDSRDRYRPWHGRARYPLTAQQVLLIRHQLASDLRDDLSGKLRYVLSKANCGDWALSYLTMLGIPLIEWGQPGQPGDGWSEPVLLDLGIIPWNSEVVTPATVFTALYDMTDESYPFYWGGRVSLCGSGCLGLTEQRITSGTFPIDPLLPDLGRALIANPDSIATVLGIPLLRSVAPAVSIPAGNVTVVAGGFDPDSVLLAVSENLSEANRWVGMYAVQIKGDSANSAGGFDVAMLSSSGVEVITVPAWNSIAASSLDTTIMVYRHLVDRAAFGPNGPFVGADPLDTVAVDVPETPQRTLSRVVAIPNPQVAGRGCIFKCVGGDAIRNVEIFDISGRIIRAKRVPGVGNVEVSWDGRNDRGVSVGAGVYWARIRVRDGFQYLRVVKL